MKSVKISFINPPEFIDANALSLSPKARDFLKSDVNYYDYTKESSVQDLFLWIMQHTKPEMNEISDDYLEGQIRAYIDKKVFEVNLSFSLAEYIQYNAIDNELFFQYSIGIGAGWGGIIEDSIHIFITNSEPEHKEEPHVHVQKGSYHDSKKRNVGSKKNLKSSSYENTIRIRLNDLELMDDNVLEDDDNSCDSQRHVFSKAEIKAIKGFLKDNKDLFIENYNMLFRGIKPAEVYFDYKRKAILFK